MKNINKIKTIFATFMIVAGFMAISSNAAALKPAYSRKGIFTGFGLGGGISLPLEGTLDPLGDIALNLQLGIGASERVTVALDIDSHLDINNDIFGGLIVPGPTVTVFIIKGFNIHASIGAAITFWENLDGVKIGMDAGIGVGYEIWFKTKWAAYFNIDADYMLINEFPDLMTINFWMGLRYY